MGKKTKLPFFPKYTNGEKPKPSSWPWPSCHQPRTHSFRTDETPESWFSNSSESPSFSTASDESATGAAVDTVETVIQGLRLRSERLFFEPSEAKLGTDITESVDSAPFKETTVLSMESLNPLVDFRESMEEMVEAQGLKDRESLEELLGWYLKANGKSSHGYILGAFVGLLLKKVAVSSSSPCSPLSFYTSSASFLSEDTQTSETPCESSLKSDDDNNKTLCLSSLSEEIIEGNGVSSCSS